jgi:membrane protein DedA with SNARE-associated domain
LKPPAGRAPCEHVPTSIEPREYSTRASHARRERTRNRGPAGADRAVRARRAVPGVRSGRALVGKLLPTRSPFVATALAVGSGVYSLLPVVATAIAGATVGQVAPFVAVRHAGVDADRLPGVEGPGVERARRWVDRWGVPAAALSNAVPLARGALTVPLAGSDVGAVRFSTASMIGTAVYVGALVALAAGLTSVFADAAVAMPF